jgi:hypothetical protein
MKKMIVVIVGMIIMTSCASSNLKESAGKESRTEKKIVQLADIKKAVESRRFIIKLEKLYSSRGLMVELIPRSNYIIIDGDKVIISAAYIGRQFGYRPIAGIDMTGTAETFKLKEKPEKGIFEINMKVKNKLNSFDVIVTISRDGYCSATMNNYKIDYIRYSGSFFPLKAREETKSEDNAVI